MNIFIYRDGTPHGPYSLEDIRKYIKGGRIVLEDQAWVQESDGHMQVKNLPGLDECTYVFHWSFRRMLCFTPKGFVPDRGDSWNLLSMVPCRT
ncbi:MAG: DUF4339 domain-containing protein [Opitutae bacterium]|nr:DUF4339 domain-containing protein [Opitutae bacterium]